MPGRGLIDGEWCESYPTIKVDGDINKQKIAAVFTNYGGSRNLSSPNTWWGHYYITFALLPKDGRGPVFLSSFGKNPNNDFPEVAPSMIPGMEKLRTTATVLTSNVESKILPEPFPYGAYRLDRGRAFNKQLKQHLLNIKNLKEDDPEISSIENMEEGRESQLSYEAFEITFAEYQKMMQEAEKIKSQEVDGKKTMAFSLLKFYEWHGERNEFVHNGLETALKLVGKQVLATQAAYEGARFAVTEEQSGNTLHLLKKSCVVDGEMANINIDATDAGLYFDIEENALYPQGDKAYNYSSCAREHRDKDTVKPSHLMIIKHRGGVIKSNVNDDPKEVMHKKFPAYNFFTLLTRENTDPYFQFFFFLNTHFRQLSKVQSSYDTHLGIFAYGDDLPRAKQMIKQHCGDMLKTLEKYLNAAKDEMPGKNIETLAAAKEALANFKVALDDKKVDAKEFADRCQAVDKQLSLLAKFASSNGYKILYGTQQCQTDFYDGDKAVSLKFSYLSNSCYHWTVDFLRKYLPGFDDRKHEGRRHYQLPHTMKHVDGRVKASLIISPRMLETSLQTRFNRIHIQAAELLYSVMIPHSAETNDVWSRVYQALEKAVRHDNPKSIAEMPTLTEILKLVGDKEKLSAKNLLIYQRFEKYLMVETELRAYETARADLMHALQVEQTVNFDTFKPLFEAADNLANTESAKLPVVTAVLNNLCALQKAPTDSGIITALQENLASVQYRTPAWKAFETCAAGSMSSILVTAGVMTFPFNPAAAVGIAVVASLLFIDFIVTANKLITAKTAEERQRENQMFSQGVNTLEVVAPGLA